ncbi:hypothetical protein [Nocardia phage NC1]|jgi:hypothetical protein|nr:hypothetical protein [Nocardia phage NC1]QSL67741.1 hypothetical protein [Nocardia phage P69]
MPKGHPVAVMRNGYKEDTRGFAQLLRRSKPLNRVMDYHAVQIMWYFRRNARRGKGPGPHNADMVRIERRSPAGRDKDRMERMIVAYGRNAAMEEFGGRANNGKPRKGQHTLRKALVYVSAGKTISRGGRVS